MAKRIMESFKLREISAVDRPAQAHAKMTIMKRHDPLAKAIVKSFTDDEAITFSQVLERNEEQSRRWKAQEALWPIMDAFRESSGKIIANDDFSDDTKLSMLESSTSDFLSAIRAKFPAVEAELSKLFPADGKVGDHIRKKEITMTDAEKKVADLEKKVGELTKSIETAAAEKAELALKAEMSDLEKAYYATLSDGDKTAFGALKADQRLTKAKAWDVEKKSNDEVIKTADGVEIRKSVVGDAAFSIMKSQEARLASQAEDLKKSQDAAAMVGFTKKAETDVGNLPGDIAKKAEVFKAVSALPAEVQTTLDAMLKAGDAAIKAAFTAVGRQDDILKAGSAAAEVAEKVAALQKAEPTISKQAAEARVYETNHGLYDRVQAEARPN